MAATQEMHDAEPTQNPEPSPGGTRTEGTPPSSLTEVTERTGNAHFQATPKDSNTGHVQGEKGEKIESAPPSLAK